MLSNCIDKIISVHITNLLILIGEESKKRKIVPYKRRKAQY